MLKTVAFTAEGETAVLTFSMGGTMRMPLLRVERVVDDEVVPEPEKSAEVLEATALDYPLRFVPRGTRRRRPPTATSSSLPRAGTRSIPELVAAVIRAESAFNPRAISAKGARGLMQLMPATAKRYGVRASELFKPERNIEAGVRYLAFLADRFADDLPKVLAGYNAGEGTVARYGGVPPYRETQGYVRRILGTSGSRRRPSAKLDALIRCPFPPLGGGGGQGFATGAR